MIKPHTNKINLELDIEDAKDLMNFLIEHSEESMDDTIDLLDSLISFCYH